MPKERFSAKRLKTVKGTSGREAVAAALAAAIEAFVVLLAFSVEVPLAVPLQLHAIAVVAVALILFYDRSADEDLTVSALMFLVILVAGPAGAIASLAALAFVDHAGAGPAVLKAWYARLSGAARVIRSTELSDNVIAGRVIDTNAATPARFEDVIAHGTMSERQAALGLMARRFHTDFAPALEAALRSPEPVVRVQAAAVVARVRSDLKIRMRALLSTVEFRSSTHRISAATELMRLAACSLVDRADAEKCRRAAVETLQALLVNTHDILAAASAADRETAPVIEAYLVSTGRYREFRVSRRIHSLVLDRNYRVRPVRESIAA